MTNDKLNAFYIAFALVLIDAVQRDTKPKSALWNRLDGAVDSINRAIKMMPAMNNEDLNNAAGLYDEMEAKIKATYGG